MKICVVQHNPQDDLKASLRILFETVRRAAEERPDLIALPEYYAFMGDGSKSLAASGAWFEEINGQTAELAKTLGIAIHAGSIAEKRETGTFNTTVVHGADGVEIARYSKIHLFDIDLPDGTQFRESDLISAGSSVETYELNGWKIGCTICYDLRFPELFRRLRDLGAELILVPAAFMRETGRAHWEVLLRARAIETGTYVAAPAQVFSFNEGKGHCYGHSLICDPWGNVIANAFDSLGFVDARLDKDYLNDVRARVPVHRHYVLT
ncbi:MAG: carbon-nitrogen hydrolase family protein [Paracoccaceae bacterium]|nr:carbon-nitrogen hydrolase family protein [Paracoccaceae bacterium]